ncbi:AAA family ATPase [Pseudomonas plecoglossicida]|uniref:AAA family ATPase n=1 Tax=Pseudomonas plecoglossicida TaxID=70775 RepID=UPI0015E440E1|nr:AAA family ATPase [Pseudomonas plecoglossicida]MBA1322973.1 AAA family ATPase [Pseudomonas plecoglossicida]
MRTIIKEIIFDGFQAENRRASVEFSGLQTSILYGDNGCGKTTFLKLMHAVLSKDSAALVKNNVYSATIVFIGEDDIERRVTVSRFSAANDDSASELIEDYDWGEFDDSALNELTSLSLGVERGVSTQTLSVESFDVARFLGSHTDIVKLPRHAMQNLAERLASYLNRQSTIRNRQHFLRSRSRHSELQLEQQHSMLQNINIANIEGLLLDRYRIAKSYASEKIQNALFDTLALAIDTRGEASTTSSIPDDLDTQIIAGKERIIEALTDGPENNFKQRIINILSSISSKDDVHQISNNNMLCQLIWNMIKELKLEKQLLNSINIFADTFNDFLGPEKELSISQEGIVVRTFGIAHDIDSMSSGERHLFTFLALVVIVARERNVLIIDEPEISLNPTWQRNLISLLEDLAPETQIIVASHSPMLAKGRPKLLVKLSPTRLNYLD